MKPFRDMVSLIADIVGILAFVGLTATGIFALLGIRGDVPMSTVVVIFLLCVALPLIAYLILKKFAPNLMERAFWRTSKEDKPLVLRAYDLKGRLPADDVLQEIHAELMAHLRKWDENATWISTRLHVSVAQAGDLFAVNVTAQSVWKKRTAEFSMLADRRDTRDRSKIIEYYEPLHKPLSHSLEEPFFTAFPEWRDEVVHAYGPTEHHDKKHLYVEVLTRANSPKLQISLKDDSQQEQHA